MSPDSFYTRQKLNLVSSYHCKTSSSGSSGWVPDGKNAALYV